jgi:Protein of unknown function (DUF3800)
MYAFIDESGDTGYTKKSSKYFIVACIILKDKRYAENKIKKLIAKLLVLNKKNLGFLHAYKETEQTRTKILKLILDLDCKIYLHINKKKNNNNIYLESLKSLINIIVTKEDLNEIFVASYDQRKSIKLDILNSFPKTKIFFTTPEDEKCIQLADFISWATFQKFENNNDVFFKEYEKLIQQNP